MALVVLGVANIAAAIYLFRRLRANFLAFLLRVLWRVLFRLQVDGLENLPPASAHSVIAVNHVSFLDAPIILSLMDEPPVFAIDHGIAKRWWIGPSSASLTRARSTPQGRWPPARSSRRCAPDGGWRFSPKDASRSPAA